MPPDHKSRLKELYPGELGGKFDDDFEVDGQALRDLNNHVTKTKEGFFPDNFQYLTTPAGARIVNDSGDYIATQVNDRIPDFERILGLNPETTDSMQTRRAAVIEKKGRRQSLEKQYYIDIVKTLFDIDITITESVETRRGTGKITSSGGTVTGEGTLFTTELQEGDFLRSGDQLIEVHSIQSPVDLKIYGSFSPEVTNASWKYQRNTFRPAWMGEFSMGDPLEGPESAVLWRIDANSVFSDKLISFLQKNKPANTDLFFVFFVYLVNDSGARIVDENGNFIIIIKTRVRYLVTPSGAFITNENGNFIVNRIV